MIRPRRRLRARRGEKPEVPAHAVTTPSGRTRYVYPRRVRLETDERRSQLLELGMRLFAERTYDEISMDDLAKEAGVSKGLVYHYFKTKRDFYLAGLREIARELIEKTTTQPANLPPLERIKRGLDAYLDHVGAHARAFVALMRGGIGSDPEVASVIEGTRTAYVERFLHDLAGSPLAAFATGNKLVRTALRGWLGFVEAASLDWLAHGDVERAKVRDMMLELLLATFRAAGAPPIPVP
jgi:AcrR family transcriptional regulator